jgi:hypothetical protein
MRNQKGSVPAILIVVIVLVIVAVGGVSWFIVSQDDDSNTNKAIINTNTTVANVNSSPIITDSKYIYNSLELYYSEKDGQIKGYNLYININGNAKIIADDIIFDAPGGSLPKLYETDDPNIVLLKAASGDMGGYTKQNYYVDLRTEDILKIVETNSIFKINNYQIELYIEDNCPTRLGLVGYEGGTAYLNDILIDEVSKYEYSPRVELTCVDPGGLGNIYEPQPRIELIESNTDMDNVYFSVLEDDFQYKVDVNTITKHPVNTNTVVDETDEDNTNSTSTILENAPEGWTRYSNEDFGLTFIYPNQSSSYRGDCEISDDLGGYMTSNAMVDLTTVEGDSKVYLTKEYYYKVTDPQNGLNGPFLGCDKITNTLNELEKRRNTFTFVVKNNISSETDLDSFINSYFGSGGCSFDSMTEWEHQQGVFKVNVQSDGPESQCFLNYGFSLLYHPGKERAITWDIGQDVSFSSDPMIDCSPEIDCMYDLKIGESVRFL